MKKRIVSLLLTFLMIIPLFCITSITSSAANVSFLFGAPLNGCILNGMLSNPTFGSSSQGSYAVSIKTGNYIGSVFKDGMWPVALKDGKWNTSWIMTEYPSINGTDFGNLTDYGSTDSYVLNTNVEVPYDWSVKNQPITFYPQKGKWHNCSIHFYKYAKAPHLNEVLTISEFNNSWEITGIPYLVRSGYRFEGWSFKPTNSINDIVIPCYANSYKIEKTDIQKFIKYIDWQYIDWSTLEIPNNYINCYYYSDIGISLFPVWTYEGDSTSNISPEIEHLIFADLAYETIKKEAVENGASVVDYFSIDGHGDSSPIYEGDNFSKIDAYKLLDGWQIIGTVSNDYGYYASVFQKNNRRVISYRGSNDGYDWLQDFEFALFNHLAPEQFATALETYYRFAEDGYDVTLTGHSLGGALATYVSIITGAKAYTYDGADGHVIDLTYFLEYPSIDFTSKYNMGVTNYTDYPNEESISANMIQHTNSDLFNGYCYETNWNVIRKKGYVITTFPHMIYSSTELKNGIPAFTELEEVHIPKSNWYASIDFKYLGIAVGGAIGGLSGGFAGLIQGGKTGYDIGRMIKTGNVILGTAQNDTLTVVDAIQSPLDLTANITANVIYGGNGADELCGSCSGDILVPGKLEGDVLVGGTGNDTYFLDCTQSGSVYIGDNSGNDIIVLKNLLFDGTESIDYIGRYGDYHEYKVSNSVSSVSINVLNTFFEHNIILTDINNKKQCSISSHGEKRSRNSSQSIEDNDASVKDITVTGADSIVIYGADGSILDNYSSNDPGIYSKEYGFIIVDSNYINASVYDYCTIQASGNNTSEIYIIETDEEGDIVKAASGTDIDLSEGTAIITPATLDISQNQASVELEEIYNSSNVVLNTNSITLEEDSNAVISAQALFENGAGSTGIYFTSSDTNVITCEYDQNGNCTIQSVGVGEATVFAIAEDSGCYSECNVTVISNPDILNNNFVVNVTNATGANYVRFAPGTYSTLADLRQAEGLKQLNASIVAAHTNADGTFSYEVATSGEYTFWIRFDDGREYLFNHTVANIIPEVEVSGVTMTVKNLDDVKDYFIALGTYSTYRECANNKVFSITSTKLAGAHNYPYQVKENGDYTVCIRYNDGSQRFLYATVEVPTPTFVQDGLNVIVGNLTDVYVIRYAPGAWNTAGEVKRAAGCRNYSGRTVIKGAEQYTLRFLESGTYTIVVQYNNGYTEVHSFEIEKKVPTVAVGDGSITFGELEGLNVIRYAPGNYNSGAEIKRAAGAKALKTIDQNGNIVISGLSGTYSFSVQYTDGSESVYHYEF